MAAMAKQFPWRLAHNSLPHRWSILRRGMEIDPLCPMCSRLNEDGGHLFLRCKPARAIWRELKSKELRTKLCCCTNSKEVIATILSQKEDIKLLCVALLTVWWRTRNKKNAGEGEATHDSIIHQIRVTANEFEQHCGHAKQEKSVPVTQWQKPEPDLLKLNIDGSAAADGVTGGWGFVVRDHSGEAVGSGAGFIAHVQDTLHAEAIACLKALEFAQSWGMTKVHVETDSQVLVHAILCNEYDLARNGVVFREIKYQALLNFSVFSISYCPRACNNVADAIAAHGAGLGQGPPVVWPGSVPDFVHVLVASDIAERTR